MEKKVLITGSEGFIGKNLIIALKNKGYNIFEVDINNKSNPIDILEKNKFNEIVTKFNPDIVVHLAASVGRVRCEDDILDTIYKNACMSAIISHCCSKNNVKLFYTSTSEIYGDFGEQTAQEDTIKKLPHNLYGLSKRWGEEVCELYNKNVCIIRPSMPYGPLVPPGRGRRAMDNMMWQAIHDMPITTHIGAERSWCWIGDLVNAYVLLIETNQTGAFNVGRDDDYRSMTEIAQRACTLAGKDYSLITMEQAPGNQTVVKRLSTEKLRSLGWVPEVELDEGEKILFEWIKKFDKNGKMK
jgi:nucleoside-diphosphate-sugar epimerase